MEIRQEQRGAVFVLSPVGRLDTDSASDLDLAIQDLLGASAKHFVLDFSELGYISSAGLQVLFSLAKQLDGGKGSLRLAGLREPVRKVFDIAGCTKSFSIYDDLAAAMDRHPQLGVEPPSIGKLAAKIFGTKGHTPSGAAGAADVAKAAAGLLGKKDGKKV